MRRLHRLPSSFVEVLRRSEAACTLKNPIPALAFFWPVLAAEAADRLQELWEVAVEILQAAAEEHVIPVGEEEVFSVFPKAPAEESVGSCPLALRF